jgi:hypothetical protein
MITHATADRLTAAHHALEQALEHAAAAANSGDGDDTERLLIETLAGYIADALSEYENIQSEIPCPE